MRIGAQLYTVRDYCKDLEGFSETLKRVSNMGYRYVQVSGTCDFDAKWLKNELAKNDLKCVLTHTKPGSLLNESERVVKNHDIFGCKNIGLGSYDFTEDRAAQCLADFKKDYYFVAEYFSKNGKYFMYHNHAKEFIKIDGKPVLQLLAETFPEEILGFTLDTYWVQAGGGNPSDWIKYLTGRVPVIHIKDYAFGQKTAAIGDGNLNFDSIFKSAENAGTEYLVVEQDDCYGENPFACLERSYNYLKSRGLY